jgi:hypothetical protein
MNSIKKHFREKSNNQVVMKLLKGQANLNVHLLRYHVKPVGNICEKCYQSCGSNAFNQIKYSELSW